MKCMYTNTDSLLNRKSELEILINMYKPDIIGITEILPKNREEDPDNCKLKIQGYEHYSNTGANSRRGVILFIREDLNATAIKLEKEAEFE